jgi:23S rRNA (adenine2503-C2)-methyltransferase
MEKKYILDIEPGRIEAEITAMGQSAFRARQITEWIYKKKSGSISEFSNLPADFRKELSAKYILRALKLKSSEQSLLDGTTRYNFETRDGYVVPCVFLPTPERNSVCVSSQAGCPVGCGFCASGKAGFKRDLSRGEILEQVIEAEKLSGKKITGVLFMGMGEPFLNYDNVESAVRSLTGFTEFGLGRKHVTVSTVGLVPEIRKFADSKPGVRLALSLHAADDETRARLIGSRIKYTVKEILEAGLYYSRTNNSRLTIEYLLAAGVNDSSQAAAKLARLLHKSLHGARDEFQVNLIPFNGGERAKLKTPDTENINRFRNQLAESGILAIVRQPKGCDIDAACGQLGV